ncbi:hypothetical protein K170097C1_22120 [Hungatella effluvii]
MPGCAGNAGWGLSQFLCLWYDECLNTKHWRYRMEEKKIDDRDRTASADSADTGSTKALGY